MTETNNSQSKDDQLTMVACRMWLHYYNNVLLQKGLITREVHIKMIHRINKEYPVRNRKGEII